MNSPVSYASMSRRSRKVKVALKYCGSCNPFVNLPRIARHLAQLAGQRGDFQLVPLSEGGVDVLVILCGCPRACGDKEEFKAGAKHSLLIAGESLGRRPVPEKCLPLALEKELIKILEQMKD